MGSLGGAIRRVTEAVQPAPAPAPAPAPPPPVDFYGNPVFTPPPQPRVVDRQQYLLDQQQEREAKAAYVQQQIAEFQRSTALRWAINNRLQNQQEELERRMRPSGASRLRPDPNRDDPNLLFNLAGGARDAVDIARTRIPYSDQAQDIAGNVGRNLAEQGVNVLARNVPVLGPLAVEGLEQTDIRPRSRAGDVGEFAGEIAVPREAWEVAVELSPFGTVGDLQRAFKEGAPEAVRAVRQVLDYPRFREALLRGEAGEGPVDPTSLIPDSVKSIITRRRGPTVPIKTEDELQEAWDVLPPTSRKLVTAMSEAVLTPQERRLAVKAGRARQTSAAREALETTTGSTLERARAARGALRGKIIPAIEPIGTKFEVPEVDEIFRGIDQAFDNKVILPQEHQAATDALHLLMYGERPLDPSKPLNLMPHEIKLLGRIYGPAFEAALPRAPQQLSIFQKVIDVLNLPRAIIAGVDVSAPGRQGIVLAFRNAEKWFGSMGPMFRAWMNEAKYERVIENIRLNPKFEEAVTHGLDLTDIGGGAAAEEAFASRLARKFPFIRRSERAYNAYLNDLRMSVYEKYANRLDRVAAKHPADWTADRLSNAKTQWAAFVNHASGRGDLGMLNEYTPTFNALFFSPRFVASRPQAVWDMVRPGTDPAVRQMVGENLAAFFGGGVTLLALAGAAGANVELDPRSTNFGKITLPKEGGGIQTIEFWGGFQPFARYAVQVATGERKAQFTGDIEKVNRGQTLGRFLRSKLSPAGALGWDVLVEGGRTFEGEELTLAPESVGAQALDRLTPLVAKDMIEAWQTSGPVAALTAGAASVIGGGVSTFAPDEQAAKEIGQSKVEQKLQAAGLPTPKVGPKTREAIADAYKVEVKNGDTLGDIRARVIERDVERVMRQMDVPRAEAVRIITNDFNNFDAVKNHQNGYEAALLEFWREHPDLLREALDAGVVESSQEKADILND